MFFHPSDDGFFKTSYLFYPEKVILTLIGKTCQKTLSHGTKLLDFLTVTLAFQPKRAHPVLHVDQENCVTICFLIERVIIFQEIMPLIQYVSAFF